VGLLELGVGPASPTEFIFYLLNICIKTHKAFRFLHKQNNILFPPTHMQVTRRKVLKPHQRNIATFLAQKCPNQDGIILYHYMGTGKSFTSMTVGINWGRKLVLLAPQMLLPQWKNDYMDQFKDTRPEVTAMVSYETVWKLLDKHDPTTEKGLQWYKEHTLIMDECHNIADWMNNRLEQSLKSTYMKRLMSFGKRVLLTGTPMYWGPRDLAFQVNIAAGKPVMPVDAAAFEREFFKTDLLKSAIVGWVQPVHYFLQWFILGIGGIMGRYERLALQFGVVSSVLAIKHDKSNPTRQIMDKGLRASQILQRCTENSRVAAELVYIGSLNKPLTWITRKSCQPMQKEYKRIVKNIENTLDTEGLPQELEVNALKAGMNNMPINESDYIIYINTMIDCVRDAKNVSRKPSQYVVPTKPQSDANGVATFQYHKTMLLNIISGMDPASYDRVNAAKERVVRELKADYSSRKSAAALNEFREAISSASNGTGKQHVDFFVGAFVNSSRRLVQSLLVGLQYLLAIFVVQCIIWIGQKVYKNQNTCRYINTAHFERMVSPYVSYYKPDVNTSGKGRLHRLHAWKQWVTQALTRKSTDTLKTHSGTSQNDPSRSVTKDDVSVDDRTFPIVIEETVRVPYTVHQTNVFIKYTMGVMDYNDYAALQIIDSPTDGQQLESFDQDSQENYEVYGSYIGNITSFKETNPSVNGDPGAASKRPQQAARHPHHKSHVIYNRSKHVWQLSPTSEFDVCSSKLQSVLARVRKHGGRQCIYSNYSLTSRIICAYLVQAFGCDCVRFVSNGATSDTQSDILQNWYYPGPRPSADAPKIIILDTKYTEGLSVLKTDVMHILDPCQSLAKEEQLKARVARLNSHRKGDTLHLYEYMAYSPTFQRMSASIAKWAKSRGEFNYFTMPIQFAQNVTPEYIVKHRLRSMDELTTRLTDKLKHTSVERYMPSLEMVEKQGDRAIWPSGLPTYCGKPIKCTIVTPGNKQDWSSRESCRRVHEASTNSQQAHSRGGGGSTRTLRRKQKHQRRVVQRLRHNVTHVRRRATKQGVHTLRRHSHSKRNRNAV